MLNKLKKYIIFIPAICVFLFCLSLWLLKNGQPEIILRIQGFDPRDLLSGHYISYRIDWENSDCTQFENSKCPKQKFGTINQRFYIPEKDAYELDRRFRQADLNDDIFEIIYAYSPRFIPVAKRLLINGKDWQEQIEN